MVSRRVVSSLVVSLLVAVSALHAGSLEKEMRSRWLGAWLVTEVESYSDCSGRYTNNRVNGDLVRGRGLRAFEPGELAQVDKVDVKHSRLDLLLSVREPVLIPYAAGPFTLFREASCRIELEVKLPRQVVKRKDADWIDDALERVVERYAREHEAVAAGSWNGRERAPYPDDYEDRLFGYAVWQAETANGEVESKLAVATEHAMRLSDRLSGDPSYMAGFATGVEEARGVGLASCEQKMKVAFVQSRATADPHSSEGAEAAREARGHDDGFNLILALQLMRSLPECFVPVPVRDDGVAYGEPR